MLVKIVAFDFFSQEFLRPGPGAYEGALERSCLMALQD